MIIIGSICFVWVTATLTHPLLLTHPLTHSLNITHAMTLTLLHIALSLICHFPRPLCCLHSQSPQIYMYLLVSIFSPLPSYLTFLRTLSLSRTYIHTDTHLQISLFSTLSYLTLNLHIYLHFQSDFRAHAHTDFLSWCFSNHWRANATCVIMCSWNTRNWQVITVTILIETMSTWRWLHMKY